MTNLPILVLKTLKQSESEFISGQIMAKQLEVSRAAIKKAVSVLKKSGYQIEAMPHRGYRLISATSQLEKCLIQQYLTQLNIDVDIEVFSVIDSTNNEGKRKAQNLKKTLLLIADQQSAGRGRQGHTFFSPAETGLYMTIVMPTHLSLQTIALCTQLMAVSACRAVDQMGGPDLQIKWVNDLYIGHKKTAGILTEAVTNLETMQVTAVVCGIGLNLTTVFFPEEISEKACSLGSLDRNELAARICASFLLLTEKLPCITEWMDEYRQRSIVLGHPLSFVKDSKTYYGIGKEIDDQGRLIVELNTGETMTLSSGEISIKPVSDG